MFDWILNKLLGTRSSDHEEADKKLVALPGNASIRPGSIVMIRLPSEDNCILKTILTHQFENFTAIIDNNLEKKAQKDY